MDLSGFQKMKCLKKSEFAGHMAYYGSNGRLDLDRVIYLIINTRRWEWSAPHGQALSRINQRILAITGRKYFA